MLFSWVHFAIRYYAELKIRCPYCTAFLSYNYLCSIFEKQVILMTFKPSVAGMNQIHTRLRYPLFIILKIKIDFQVAK